MSRSCSAAMRARISAVPPAGSGTTMVMARFGNAVWACTGVPDRARTTPRHNTSKRNICVSSRANETKVLNTVRSLELHAGGLDDLLPALDLLAHVGGGGLRRAADRLGGKIRQAPGDLRALQRLVDVDVDLVGDRLRRLRWRNDRVPRGGL